MPVPEVIVHAAASYRYNAQMLEKSVAGLTADEMKARPNDTSNPMFWIVGHSIWARAAALGLLGGEWSRPWAGLFARGVEVSAEKEYPATEELLASWQELKATFDAALENVSEEVLAGPPHERIPSFDGKRSGVVSFLAWHEAYHVGQAAYLRRWLGHDQVAG